MLSDYKDLQEMNHQSEVLLKHSGKENSEKTEEEVLLDVIESEEETVSQTTYSTRPRSIANRLNQFKKDPDSTRLTIHSVTRDLPTHTATASDAGDVSSVKSKGSALNIRKAEVSSNNSKLMNIQERPMSSGEIPQNTFYVTQ